MIAKIMHNDSVYYSPVLAVTMKRAPIKAVIFDSSFSRLIVVDVFNGNKYTVLFMNMDTDGFSIDEEDFKSYWNDRNIFKTVKSKRYTSKMLEEAREILSRCAPQEFTEVKAQPDLDALAFNTASFHDGYVLGMQEKDGELHILIDTSWGSFAILRCKGVIENTLRLGTTFFHCDMKIDENEGGIVEFSFEPEWSEEAPVLKAKEVRFKPLFERRIPLGKLDYSVSNDRLTINCGSQVFKVDKTSADVLDFGERSVLGYLEIGDTMLQCSVFCGDLVLNFREYIGNVKKAKKAFSKGQIFKQECEQNGFYFDEYPWYDECDEIQKIDYGEVIYTQKYGKIYGVLLYISIFTSITLANSMLWLIIQLLNPGMQWGMFFLFGLGVPLAVFLIGLIIYIAQGLADNAEQKRLEIFENGILYVGYNTGFSAGYEHITKVEYKKKRITVYWSNVKFALHRSKNDAVIYDLIEKKLSEKKE